MTAGGGLRAILLRTRPVDRALFAVGLFLSGMYWVIALTPGADIPDLIMALANMGLTGCLLFRNAFPIPVAIATALWLVVMTGTSLLSSTPLSMSPLLLAAPLVLLTLTKYVPSKSTGIIALGVTALGSLVSPIVQNSAAPVWVYAAHLAVLAVTYLWARWRRQEREFREHEVEANAALAKAEERNRLSAELHDVLGYSLIVIHAQASAQIARNHAHSDTSDSLRAIRDVSKAALQELRALVGTIESSTTVALVGLTQLPNLLGAARATGVDIRATVPDIATLEGWDEDLSPTTRLAITRCFQEGLTNALRHGEPTQGIDIELSRDSHQLAFRISNVIPRRRRERLGSSGMGLGSLHERVTALGGHIRTSRNHQVFDLNVYLPLEGKK